MCLGIPGRVVVVGDNELAEVDVLGVVRTIHVGLLEDPLSPGDHILIHSGFALERMTPEQARDALGALAPGGLADDDAVGLAEEG